MESKQERACVEGALQSIYDAGAKTKVKDVPLGSIVLVMCKDELDVARPEGTCIPFIVYAQYTAHAASASLYVEEHSYGSRVYGLRLEHGEDCVILHGKTPRYTAAVQTAGQLYYQKNRNSLRHRLVSYFRGRTPEGREAQRLAHLIRNTSGAEQQALKDAKSRVMNFTQWKETPAYAEAIQYLETNPVKPHKLKGQEGSRRYAKMRDWWLVNTPDGKVYARLRRVISLRRKLKQDEQDLPEQLKALPQFADYRVTEEGKAALAAAFPEYFE